MRAGFEWLMGLTPAEETEALAAAGRPWRTAYYVASHDWPVPPEDVLTLREAYEAVAQIAAVGQLGEGDNGA